jgi:hypothetical protein
MTHDELVEKVARAIYADKFPNTTTAFDDLYYLPKDNLRYEARAAIAAVYEAIREPSNSQIDIGSGVIADGAEWGNRSNAAEAYRVMTDASALNPKGG